MRDYLNDYCPMPVVMSHNRSHSAAIVPKSKAMAKVTNAGKSCYCEGLLMSYGLFRGGD